MENKSAKDLTNQELKDIIQRNYDNENWYGPNQKDKLFTLACQLTLIEREGKSFTPEYNCPA